MSNFTKFSELFGTIPRNVLKQVDSDFPGNYPFPAGSKAKIAGFRYVATIPRRFGKNLLLVPDVKLVSNSVFNRVTELLDVDDLAPSRGGFISESALLALINFLTGEGSRPADDIVGLVGNNVKLRDSFIDAINVTYEGLIRYDSNVKPYRNFVRNEPEARDYSSFKSFTISRENFVKSVNWIQGRNDVGFVDDDDIANQISIGLDEIMLYHVMQQVRENLLSFVICNKLGIGSGLTDSVLIRMLKDQIKSLFMKGKHGITSFQRDQSGNEIIPDEITVIQDFCVRLVDILVLAGRGVPNVAVPYRILHLINFRSTNFKDPTTAGIVDPWLPGNVFTMLPDRNGLSFFALVVLHEMIHMFQGLLSDLSRLGSDAARIILSGYLAALGLSFDPGDLCQWRAGLYFERPAEIMAMDFMYAFAWHLTGPGGAIDRSNWKRLTLTKAQLDSWGTILPGGFQQCRPKVTAWITRLMS
ncbi:MAG: hypothetical protein LBT40_03105 [Deltaproteobacteria bacterium]|jgi:hypothetical protein|nr:hypothetical protein [Deltaproteobacteria bacterium]